MVLREQFQVFYGETKLQMNFNNQCFVLTSAQVLNFVQKFADLLPDYEVACEHEHSNCVLIAHKKVHC